MFFVKENANQDRQKERSILLLQEERSLTLTMLGNVKVKAISTIFQVSIYKERFESLTRLNQRYESIGKDNKRDRSPLTRTLEIKIVTEINVITN